MAGWGYCFYGPYQHWWYGLLAKSFGAPTTPNFLIKVRLLVLLTLASHFLSQISLPASEQVPGPPTQHHQAAITALPARIDPKSNTDVLSALSPIVMEVVFLTRRVPLRRRWL